MHWTGYVTHKPFGSERSWAAADVTEAMPDEITVSNSERVEDRKPVCLVATRFHRVEGMCKLKTRTHKRNLAPTWENLQPPLFVATRFHLVGEVQVGKLAPTWENAVAMAVETSKAE